MCVAPFGTPVSTRLETVINLPGDVSDLPERTVTASPGNVTVTVYSSYSVLFAGSGSLVAP